MRVIAEGTARAYNLAAEVAYSREFAPLINDAACAAEAVAAARAEFGEERVEIAEAPITASEDFAHFLEHAPGCFVFIGNGVESAPLHNPSYDFNDAVLLDGARFHAAIVRRRLGA